MNRKRNVSKRKPISAERLARRKRRRALVRLIEAYGLRRVIAKGKGDGISKGAEAILREELESVR